MENVSSISPVCQRLMQLYNSTRSETATISWIWYGVMLPCFIATGVTANMVTLAVLIRSSFMRPLRPYLISLTIWDTVLLLSSLVGQSLIAAANDEHIRNTFYSLIVETKLFMFFMHFSKCQHIWITMAITIERYIAVCYPLKRRTMNNSLMAVLLLTLSLAVSLIYATPRYFDITVVRCDMHKLVLLVRSYFHRSESYRIVYRIIFTSMVVFVAPLIGLVAMTIRMTLTIRKSLLRELQGNDDDLPIRRKMGIHTMFTGNLPYNDDARKSVRFNRPTKCDETSCTYLPIASENPTESIGNMKRLDVLRSPEIKHKTNRSPSSPYHGIHFNTKSARSSPRRRIGVTDRPTLGGCLNNLRRSFETLVQKNEDIPMYAHQRYSLRRLSRKNFIFKKGHFTFQLVNRPLLLVVLAHIICYMLPTLQDVLEFLLPKNWVVTGSPFDHLISISATLIILDASLPFFVYIISSERFRTETKKLFTSGCVTPKKQNRRARQEIVRKMTLMHLRSETKNRYVRDIPVQV